MSAIQYAVLNFGFAENYMLASLIVANVGVPFASEEEAMQSLANDLLAMYKTYHHLNDAQKECCANNSDRNYCPDCGTAIADTTIYAEEFENWVVGLTADSLDMIGTLEDDVEERYRVGVGTLCCGTDWGTGG